MFATVKLYLSIIITFYSVTTSSSPPYRKFTIFSEFGENLKISDIRHFVERPFVYWTISSKNLFVEVSFRRMSTSSKHVSSNTFDEIFYAHPAAIIYLLVMWPRILSIANSVLSRGNISRSDLNNSFYPGIYASNFSCLVLSGFVQQWIAQYKCAFIKFWDRIVIHFNVTCIMNIRWNYFIWRIIIMSEWF